MPIKKDDRFNKLVAVKKLEDSHSADGRKLWIFLCDCGKSVTRRPNDVARGKNQSCGCMFAESHRQHGMYGTKFYKAWVSMNSRCSYDYPAHRYHFGKGIKVCNRWKKFANFMKDMLEDYQLFEKKNNGISITLDRIDSNKNYYKENCRWATYKDQSRNRVSNNYLVVAGVKKLMVEWANETGQSLQKLFYRKKMGWSDKETVYGKYK